ncbi:DUF4037 domain-containing protein [Microbacterium lushaniae]|nr:DUF4037 domain-containing protein [Microbacterium lushaniae]KAA9159236.1 DUF4037 domain-containing protein [Microbacterium lushaniae]
MNSLDSRPGAEISRAFYRQVVQPLLYERWPGLPHAAARLGAGSDVLGLDDDISRDHDWGLRLSLFVAEDLVRPVDAYLAAEMPAEFAGLPTRFAFTGAATPRHHVETQTVEAFVRGRLGLDDVDQLDAGAWLSFTGQSVLEVTAGPVFHDDGDVLRAVRRALEWYPRDVWAYVVASCWTQLEEEMPLMGRAGQVGDERGARVIAASLIRTVMQLTFLLHRAWAPYAKWFGSLFARLPDSAPIGAHVDAALGADTWQSRQKHIACAIDALLDLQGRAGLPAPGPATLPFWDRPFLYPNPEIASALRESITDPAVRVLPRGRGGIEQITDNVALLVNPRARLAVVRAA